MALRKGNKCSEDLGQSEICNFYNGRSVFITGAAGFLGRILLETLLRCCPGIVRIYVLLRERKGVQPIERMRSTFDKTIFNTLKKENPEVLQKVIVVTGDVSQPDLGISCSELEMILEDVSVVFHSAAIIQFNKPLSYMITQNVIGTDNVVKLCRKLRKLSALVYVSTAYSNANKKTEILEQVTRLPVPAKYFLDAVKSQDETTLSMLVKQCLPEWPNTYTFSKALAEHFLVEEATDVPFSIVRPSIISSTWKGALPGYVELGTGLADITFGIGSGFLHALICKLENTLDIIPADVVANTLIISSWCTGTRRVESPLIVNCTSGTIQPVTWNRFMIVLMQVLKENPLPRAFQSVNISIFKNKASFNLGCLFHHYIPAVIIDLIRLAVGSKPKLTKLYGVYQKAVGHLSYFSLNQWEFRCDNFLSLMETIKEEDSQIFDIDIRNMNWEKVARALPKGAPFYNWESDRRSKQQRSSIIKRRYIAITGVKFAVLFVLLFCLFRVWILGSSVLLHH